MPLYNPPAAGASAATQADQETATSTAAFVSPGRQQFHPSAAKCWCIADISGSMATNYNMTSVTDVGAGDITFTIATDFSSVNWCAQLSQSRSGTVIFSTFTNTFAAGSISAECWSIAAVKTDPVNWCFTGFGDQA